MKASIIITNTSKDTDARNGAKRKAQPSMIAPQAKAIATIGNKKGFSVQQSTVGNDEKEEAFRVLIRTSDINEKIHEKGNGINKRGEILKTPSTRYEAILLIRAGEPQKRK